MSKVTETWLSNPASIKGILVEVTASIYDSVNVTWVETPLYLSNIGYLTTDNLTMFNPIIVGGLQITESISLEGNVSMSFGDIGLSNPNGDLDNWLDSSKYIWTNRAVKVYVGDPSWVCTNLAQVRTDFELVFSGLVSDIDASSREQVNLKIRDSLERLNTPLTDSKLGTYGTWSGGQTNQDTVKPVVFGEAFNITPLLIDPSQLEYMYNEPKQLTLANVTQTNPAVITASSQLAVSSGWGTSTLNAAAWNGSIYCIVGSAGRIATSPDGNTWTLRTNNAGTNNLNGIAWNGTVFLAVGAAGISQYSYDGITWTSMTVYDSTVTGNCVIWTGTLFCIGLSNGTISTSSTGIGSWNMLAGPSTSTNATTGLTTSWGTNAINDIVWTGSKFCAVGIGGRVATSTDATAAVWTYQPQLASTTWSTSTVLKVIWAGTQFCISGAATKIATSSDGVTWTHRTGFSTLFNTTTASIFSLGYSGTKIFAGSTSGRFAYSLDGITWVNITTNLTGTYFNTVSVYIINWSNNRLLMGGTSGRVAVTNRDFPTGLIELSCDNTSSLSVNDPITFQGTSFGGIATNTTYYIKSIPVPGIITISSSVGGAALTFTTASGNLAIIGYVGNEQVIEIRDNGVPIYNSTTAANAIINATFGTFKLLKTPVGVITASIQGSKGNINLSTKAVTPTYKNTITNIIALICTNYGKASTRLNVNELDIVNLNAFDIANAIPIAYYVTDRENVLTVCQNILSSIGAQLYITKSGLLQILRIGVPTTDTVVNITDNDIIQHSLTISNKLTVSPSTKLGYAKNWTVQNSLVSNIPDAHKATFAEEWLTTTATDSTISTLYNITTDPVQKNTALITNIDAYTESARLTNYYKSARIVYKFTGTARLFILKLGQSVTLTHNRFNLSSGKTGQVISLNYDWIAGTINVEVLV